MCRILYRPRPATKPDVVEFCNIVGSRTVGKPVIHPQERQDALMNSEQPPHASCLEQSGYIVINDIDEGAGNYQDDENCLQEIIQQCLDKLPGLHGPHCDITERH